MTLLSRLFTRDSEGVHGFSRAFERARTMPGEVSDSFLEEYRELASKPDAPLFDKFMAHTGRILSVASWPLGIPLGVVDGFENHSAQIQKEQLEDAARFKPTTELEVAMALPFHHLQEGLERRISHFGPKIRIEIQQDGTRWEQLDMEAADYLRLERRVVLLQKDKIAEVIGEMANARYKVTEYLAEGDLDRVNESPDATFSIPHANGKMAFQEMDPHLKIADILLDTAFWTRKLDDFDLQPSRLKDGSYQKIDFYSGMFGFAGETSEYLKECKKMTIGDAVTSILHDGKAYSYNKNAGNVLITEAWDVASDITQEHSNSTCTDIVISRNPAAELVIET